MATRYRPSKLARANLRAALRGRRTTDSDKQSVRRGRICDQGGTGFSARTTIWYCRDFRGYELPNVESLSGCFVYLGECPFCDQDTFHNHTIVTAISDLGQAISRVVGPDAERTQ